MGKIATGRIFIEGLYDMGTCWRSHEAARLWEDFWLNECSNIKDETAVAYTEDRCFGKQFYIVGNGISVYLHPLSTSFVFSSSNSADTENLDMEVNFISDRLKGLKSFMQSNGIDIKICIDWKVIKASYKDGLERVSYIPDFDGETFRKDL